MTVAGGVTAVCNFAPEDGSKVVKDWVSDWRLTYGGRPFEVNDESRNNWAVALVAPGEGWHHNHHAFPTSARHGLLRGQLDPSHAIIRGLERAGWATNVRHVTPARLAAKRGDGAKL